MQTRFGSAEERYRYARPADLDTITTTLMDPDVGTWLWFVPAPQATLSAYFSPLVEAQWQSLANGQPPEVAVFVVEDPQGAYLGHGAVVAVEGSPRGFEIGFALNKPAWGRGVGMRLGEFLVAWAVQEHKAYRIQAGCIESNAGSRRILEKLGLALEGTRPDFRTKGDVRHTELEFGARVADLDAASIRATVERDGIEPDV